MSLDWLPVPQDVAFGYLTAIKGWCAGKFHLFQLPANLRRNLASFILKGSALVTWTSKLWVWLCDAMIIFLYYGAEVGWQFLSEGGRCRKLIWSNVQWMLPMAIWLVNQVVIFITRTEPFSFFPFFHFGFIVLISFE